jgi:hypothetical protein
MATSHLGAFAFVYLLPFLVALFALSEEFRQGNGKSSIFLIFGLIVFTLHLFSTMKFTVDIAQYEQFSRLHARYYFMTYPFFIYSFMAFGGTIVWSFRRRLILAVCLIILVLQYIFIFYPNFVRRINNGYIVDNMDLSWLLLAPRMLVKLSFAVLLSLLLFYVIRRAKMRALPYIVFFLIMTTVQNVGHVYALKKLHYKDALDTRSVRSFVQKNIPDLNSKVMMLGSGPKPMLNTSFWLPYQYTEVIYAERNKEINTSMIPPGTEYVILFDEYRLNLPSDYVAHRYDTDKCAIIEIHKAGVPVMKAI